MARLYPLFRFLGGLRGVFLQILRRTGNNKHEPFTPFVAKKSLKKRKTKDTLYMDDILRGVIELLFLDEFFQATSINTSRMSLKSGRRLISQNSRCLTTSYIPFQMRMIANNKSKNSLSVCENSFLLIGACRVPHGNGTSTIPMFSKLPKICGFSFPLVAVDFLDCTPILNSFAHNSPKKFGVNTSSSSSLPSTNALPSLSIQTQLLRRVKI